MGVSEARRRELAGYIRGECPECGGDVCLEPPDPYTFRGETYVVCDEGCGWAKPYRPEKAEP